MSLEIIIKTCDGESLHGSNSLRYCQTDKRTLILKCLSSILYSAHGRKSSTKITIIDDASSDECLTAMDKLLKTCAHPCEFIIREKRDYNEATLQYFEKAKNSDKTFVYLVEDDYLHFPYALSEIENFYKYAFSQFRGSKDIAIHPFDDPDNYLLRSMQPSNIVQHGSRHWRTNYNTTCTVFTTPGLINRGWEHFENFANYYGKEKEVCEDTTINHVWAEPSVQLFTPMPSLALHMQFEASIDRMVNWKNLWNSIPDAS